MKLALDIIKGASALVGAWLGQYLGGFDGVLLVLLVVVVIDYVSGVAVAFVNKRISSEVGFRGICKKVMVFALVGVGHLLDIYIVKQGQALRFSIIFFYIANEGISVIENAGNLGLPLPKILVDTFAQIKGERENE